jgi:glycosyltransferase involved in cell wall biosynthesis
MRVLFLSHYFHPESGAAQTRIFEAATRLQRRGHTVSVLTGFPNYPDGVIPPAYRGRPFMRERMHGLHVIRTPILPAPNRGFAKRLLNHTSFAGSSLLGVPATGPVDVVVAESPPLFTAVSAVPIARARRARLLLNVADLWPESAVQLGLLSNAAAIRGAELLERFSYAGADAITVPTPGMRDILVERGLPADKVILLRNAVDVDRFAPGPPAGTAGRRIVYSGTVGLAQGVGTLIDAARGLEQSGEPLEVVIAGDGAEREELERRAADLEVRSVRFAGRLAREEVPSLIASADVAVMSLRDLPLFLDAVPTKLLEYMAAGKPVVAAAAGEVARMIDEAEAGITCAPEDPAAMAAAIRTLLSDPPRARAMGANGRRYVEQHLSRDAFVDKLETVLRALTD